MTHSISYDVQGYLDIVTFNDPPLNLLSAELSGGPTKPCIHHYWHLQLFMS